MLTCVITLILLITCVKVFITLLYSCNGSQSVYTRSDRISRSNPIGRYVGVSIGATTYWGVIIRTTTLLRKLTL
jgi:NAD/NADP transhydrogenase beta subunit